MLTVVSFLVSEACIHRAAEQSVHLTLGILRKPQAVFYALAFFWLDGFAVPAPAQVTQTVGWQKEYTWGIIYVPQKYLKGFAEAGNPDAIWMYDKKLRQFTNPGIKSIAQESGFYTNDVEQQLNELVEKPANKVLDKLRNQERITETVTVFILAFISLPCFKRVPKRRAEAYALIPNVFEKTITNVRTQIQEWGQTTLKNKELFLERKVYLK